MENKLPKYISRDLSWLSFNHRVLQEAQDFSVPLLERIKFLAIYSSNLDEFFRVRVASLRSFKELRKPTRKALNVRPKKELKVIRKIVQEQQETFGHIFRSDLLPALERVGIHLIKKEAFTPAQVAFSKQYFFEKVHPIVHPVLIQPEEEEIPFLKNKQLYFIVSFKGQEKLGLIEIPSDQLARFVRLPGEKAPFFITFLDDIISANCQEWFDDPIESIHAIKMSRDAEMYIDDEYSGDLLEKIKQGLTERNIGLPTRFLYDSAMPEGVKQKMKRLFRLTKNDLIPGARYHNFNDFFGFPDPTNNPELHYPPMPPVPHPDLEGANSLLDALKEKDHLLHFPYQQYHYVPALIMEAAKDETVSTIKATLYRVASKSAIVLALMEACKEGKKVVAFIEAKARFDEASNLFWGEELEKAGATVIYSYPGIKVHTKLLLISKAGSEEPTHFAYLGTGNFNEKTAKIYGDHALLTSDPRLTKEVSQVFDLLERKIIMPTCKHLLVAPFNLRNTFKELINEEIAQAKAGKEAYMILKMNSLEDKGMIDKLYEASEAGVHIQLIIRGICCLIPGVKGLSENIRAISIVDRFLEHARVYIFGNGGQEKMYVASADWMSRNLYRRVEVGFPIYDKVLYQQLRDIINLQLADNTKARIINESQDNPYVQATKGEPEHRAQADIYKYCFIRQKNKEKV
ncbi:MAG: polyphosphate kinase 1 [Saprospiraceae bacterium]